MSIKFGWKSRHDDRSKAYALDPALSGLQRRSMRWACSLYLDQFDEPACTGFAVCHEAAAEPFPIPNLTAPHARALYQRAKELDQWPGEDYDGSSVLGAMKAAVEKGWYKEYRWAFGEKDLALAIGYMGPAVLGIPWTEAMMEPASNGVIRAAGATVGGHAILCVGYDVVSKLYRLHNSWGISYGLFGDVFLPADDLAMLLKQGGEACIPTVRAGC